MPKSRTRSKSVYTPPPRSTKAKVSPRWLVPTMLACLLLGLAWIALFYITGGTTPVQSALGDWNLVIGFGFIIAGVALSTKEAIGYAQRGRGERKRPPSGWGSLTPTECDVVRLVSEGLGNNDIATRLFLSAATVDYHLRKVYRKLDVPRRASLHRALRDVGLEV